MMYRVLRKFPDKILVQTVQQKHIENNIYDIIVSKFYTRMLNLYRSIWYKSAPNKLLS